MDDGSLIFLAFLVIGLFAIVWGYSPPPAAGSTPAPTASSTAARPARARAARSRDATRRRAPCASGRAARADLAPDPPPLMERGSELPAPKPLRGRPCPTRARIRAAIAHTSATTPRETPRPGPCAGPGRPAPRARPRPRRGHARHDVARQPAAAHQVVEGGGDQRTRLGRRSGRETRTHPPVGGELERLDRAAAPLQARRTPRTPRPPPTRAGVRPDTTASPGRCGRSASRAAGAAAAGARPA